MSRLYEAKYDKERWKVDLLSDENYKTYKLIDKEEMEIYHFHNIIGFEQVAGNDFLVYRKSSGDNFAIIRCILDKSKIDTIYSHEFSRFDFINDDRIAFTYWGKTGPYVLSGIYSISENKELEEAKWLKGMGFEVSDNALLIEDRISNVVLGTDRILFTIDPDTLEINSEIYSSFRDGYVRLNSKEDYKEFRYEEQKYNDYISAYCFEQQKKAITKATKRILKKENN